MLRKINKNTILFKIFIVFFFGWIISMSIALFVVYLVQNQMESNAIKALKANNEMVARMLEGINTTMVRNINKINDKFNSRFTGTFTLDTSKNITIGEMQTPALIYENKQLNLNFDIVDSFTKDTGAVATIFAKKGDDFVRITTSLKKEDGKSRAIGTMLGKSHPAYQLMLDGKTYIGKAVLFGRDYMTKYVPIKKGAEVIGILFVGIDFTTELKETMDSIRAMKLGKTGYFYIVDGAEKTFGRFLLHPTIEGKNILEIKNRSGVSPITKEALKQLFETKEGVFEYIWAVDDKETEKIAVFTKLKDWNWGIIISITKDEFYSEIRQIRWIIILCIWFVNIIVTSIVIYALYKTVSKPVRYLLSSVTQISQGNLAVSADYRNDDEIGALFVEFNKMVASLKSIIQNILVSSQSASDMVNQLKSNAHKTSEHAKKQSTQADTIAATSSEMSQTINEIAMNAETASNTANKSSQSATHGLEVAEVAVNTVKGVNEATLELSRTVSGLEQRSNEISDIIIVIKEIADQTNLLALNAAIEAARAGEQGRGFAVVADEVRKLAERTINATTEISSKITSIQEEVLKTKTSMDTASNQVQKATDYINEVGGALRDIVNSIEVSRQQMSQIAAAVVQQSAASEDVAKNIDNTAAISREVELMANDILAEADKLLEVVKNLKGSASGFRI